MVEILFLNTVQYTVHSRLKTRLYVSKTARSLCTFRPFSAYFLSLVVPVPIDRELRIVTISTLNNGVWVGSRSTVEFKDIRKSNSDKDS